jgi:hypothetical protein
MGKIFFTPHKEIKVTNPERVTSVLFRQSLKWVAEQGPHQQDSNAWVGLGSYKPFSTA